MYFHQTTTELGDMVDEIQLEIPEVPVEAINLHCRRAIIEFCELSHFWREEVGPIRVVKGADGEMVEEYDLPVPQSRYVASVMKVTTIKNNRLITLQRAENRENLVILHRHDQDEVFYRYWQDTPFTIRFAPADRLEGQDMSIEAALVPNELNKTIEFSAEILRNYRDALTAGAKARLYKIPRKPWSDVGQYQVNREFFEREATASLRHQARGFSRLPDKAPDKERKFY